ncbi:MAG: hypothetical protein KA020_08470 [Planctomycetes bacterium]|nr:hypothetical protein [Planctomycetota bacterium]
MRSILVMVVAMVGACAVRPAHFVDAHREHLVASFSQLLDELGEAAPGPRERVVRFVWSTAFAGDHVITVGIDGDTGYVRCHHRPPDSRVWKPPELRFLEPREVLVLLADRPIRAGWKDPGIVGDGEVWLFEGPGWCCYRHSPDSSDEWREFGVRLAACAEVVVPPRDP